MKIIRYRVGKKGYTIIEVMIFLAVSGFMFVLAAIFINGKQDQVAFQQGMQAAGATVTGVINSVANGEYLALPSGRECVVSGPSAPAFPATGAGGASSQGTNAGCVFMGRVLQFGTDAADSQKVQYKTYTVAGRQYAPTTGSCAAAGNSVPAQSFCQAEPVTSGSEPDLTTAGSLENGLSFSGAYLCSQASCNSSNAQAIGGVGFFSSFGSYSGGSANVQATGSQTVTVVSLPQTGDMVNTVNYDLNKAYIGAPAASLPDVISSGSFIVLCFTRGNQLGSVSIGGSGGQVTAVSINMNKSDVCNA